MTSVSVSQIAHEDLQHLEAVFVHVEPIVSKETLATRRLVVREATPET
ncbi:hypothetical protein [Pseudomonas brassicacearum]|nr:hypothetical protein [Pseudomonas brassicacearum]